MPAPFNPYEILGVSRDADASTIKAAHRQRARQTHPDTGGDARVFADVQRAYEILSNPDKRTHYDATGEADQLNPNTTDPAAWGVVADIIKAILAGEAEPEPHHDLVDTIAVEVQKAIDHINGALRIHDRIQRRAAKLATKFLPRREGAENILAQLVLDQARMAAENRGKALRALACRERALELVKTYRFDVVRLITVVQPTASTATSMQQFYSFGRFSG